MLIFYKSVFEGKDKFNLYQKLRSFACDSVLNYLKSGTDR